MSLFFFFFKEQSIGSWSKVGNCCLGAAVSCRTHMRWYTLSLHTWSRADLAKAACPFLAFPEPDSPGLRCLGFHRCRLFVSVLLMFAAHHYSVLNRSQDSPTLDSHATLNHCCEVSRHCLCIYKGNTFNQSPLPQKTSLLQSIYYSVWIIFI